jgi:alcohol dehydrogenase class IV
VAAETVFTYAAPGLKFGPGASAELAHDLAALGCRRVLLVTDPGVLATGAPERIVDQLRAGGVDVEVYADVHVEPTDRSLQDAVEHARGLSRVDGVVAVGGGSSIDTAKAVNLMLCAPGELMDYVNAPIGNGQAPPTDLLPLVAVPTTTGTGAESTTVCVLDVLARKVKTGISHARLRPTLAVIDPELTMSQPAGVTASAGMDILCHALESYTARPYATFERKRADERVPYCGANPISDMWAERAMSLLAQSFRRAVTDGGDVGARTDMALAATFAGLGFGNAGVHVPHANAYPVAGQVREFRAEGYPGDGPLVPHGMSVAMTAPESFRFTYSANPDRHVRAAELLAPGVRCDDAVDLLPTALTELMRDIGLPSGLAELGFGADDVPALVEGSLAQPRLLSISPRPVEADDLATIFSRSMQNW